MNFNLHTNNLTSATLANALNSVNSDSSVNHIGGHTITLQSLLPPVDLSKPSSILGEPPYPKTYHAYPDDVRHHSAHMIPVRPITLTAPPSSLQKSLSGNLTQQLNNASRQPSGNPLSGARSQLPNRATFNHKQRRNHSSFRMVPTPAQPPPILPFLYNQAPSTIPSQQHNLQSIVPAMISLLSMLLSYPPFPTPSFPTTHPRC